MIDSSTPLGDDMEAREAMFSKFSHLLRHGLTDPHDYSSELKDNSPDTAEERAPTPTIGGIGYGEAEFTRAQAKPFAGGCGSNNQPEGFMKFDSDKPRMSLVDPDFVKGLADILTFGAQKYEADNWKLLDRKELYRYKDALLRHMYAYLGGELTDEESGRPHLDCVAFNLMALRYFEHGAGFNKGGQ